MSSIPPLATKLVPPPPPRRPLARPALLARLDEAMEHRLTLIHAGTGYGKSTTLAAWAQQSAAPIIWYSVEEADSDPYRFLSHLLAAIAARLPNFPDSPRAILDERGAEGSRAAWLQALDSCINALDRVLTEPTALILDDFHFVGAIPEIALLTTRLLTFVPSRLHVLISTRHVPDYPEWLRWRTRGEVLDIGTRDLAFTPTEVAQFLRAGYDVEADAPAAQALVAKAEGWPIALPLIGHALRAEQDGIPLESLPPLDTLFDYLSQALLDRLPPTLVEFLRETAILRELTPSLCDAVREQRHSADLLERLTEMDLFVVRLSATRYRYHHLFADFLRRQDASDVPTVQARHRRAGAFLQTVGEDAEAIHHWLAASAFDNAAALIAQVGEATLRVGQADSVTSWIAALPPDTLAGWATVQALLGDIARLRSRFDESLSWYSLAEHTACALHDRAATSRALHGQAMVYLDTVRPAQAEALLQEALRMSDGMADQQNRARLLDLLAENKLNLGRPDEAEALLMQARQLRDSGPTEDALSVRVKLRTGRLNEAQQILEGWLDTERGAAARGALHSPRSHRETAMLLSLIYAFRGEAAEARRLAEEGIALGEQMASPFVTALGHARLAHAWQITPPPLFPPQPRVPLEKAIRAYHTSMALGQTMAVRRFNLESLWGLTRAYAFIGNLEAAEASAAEARDVGRSCGDRWVSGLADLALGAGYVVHGRYEDGATHLRTVLATFRDCRDAFGRAATRLWQALAYYALGQSARLDVALDDLLALVEGNGYDFLLTRPTLLGVDDRALVIPLLLRARTRGRYRHVVNRLLDGWGMAGIESHPGYQLRVQTLGSFRLWRGVHEVEAREWQREKARHLFQLFLTEGGGWLQRDEIVDRLWPTLGAEAATRDFKVALTTLNKVLEPQRAPDAPYAFVARSGTTYRLYPNADLCLDVTEFRRGLAEADRLHDAGDEAGAIGQYEAALALYGGPYLPDALYEAWSQPRRDKLLDRYLHASERLTALLLRAERYPEAIAWATRALDADPCWEAAYRTLMAAHAALGDRALLPRLYQRCVSALQSHLDAEPSAETTALFERLR